MEHRFNSIDLGQGKNKMKTGIKLGLAIMASLLSVASSAAVTYQFSADVLYEEQAQYPNPLWVPASENIFGSGVEIQGSFSYQPNDNFVSVGSGGLVYEFTVGDLAGSIAGNSFSGSFGYAVVDEENAAGLGNMQFKWEYFIIASSTRPASSLSGFEISTSSRTLDLVGFSLVWDAGGTLPDSSLPGALPQYGDYSIELVFQGFNDLGFYQRVISGPASVTPVPVPAAVWLFGSALIGLVGIRRKG